MKQKEFEQLKTKPVEELKKDLTDYKDKLWNLKIDLAAGKIKNVKEIKKTKRNIARALTLLNQHGK